MLATAFAIVTFCAVSFALLRHGYSYLAIFVCYCCDKLLLLCYYSLLCQAVDTVYSEEALLVVQSRFVLPKNGTGLRMP